MAATTLLLYSEDIKNNMFGIKEKVIMLRSKHINFKAKSEIRHENYFQLNRKFLILKHEHSQFGSLSRM